MNTPKFPKTFKACEALFETLQDGPRKRNLVRYIMKRFPAIWTNFCGKEFEIPEPSYEKGLNIDTQENFKEAREELMMAYEPETEEPTVVIFIKHDGEIIAIFPYVIETWQGNVSSYMHVGQHAAASLSILEDSELATEEEYAPLKQELESIGYKLIVVDRVDNDTYQASVEAFMQEEQSSALEEQEEEAEKEYSLLEAVADIAYNAGWMRYRPSNSRDAISNFIAWAKEFEELNKGVEWGVDKEYIEEIDAFASKKIAEAMHVDTEKDEMPVWEKKIFFFNITGKPAIGFEGFTDGDKWNGWSNPHFTPEIAREYAKWQNKQCKGTAIEVNSDEELIVDYSKLVPENDGDRTVITTFSAEFPTEAGIAYIGVFPLHLGLTWEELPEQEFRAKYPKAKVVNIKDEWTLNVLAGKENE